MSWFECFRGEYTPTRGCVVPATNVDVVRPRQDAREQRVFRSEAHVTATRMPAPSESVVPISCCRRHVISSIDSNLINPEATRFVANDQGRRHPVYRGPEDFRRKGSVVSFFGDFAPLRRRPPADSTGIPCGFVRTLTIPWLDLFPGSLITCAPIRQRLKYTTTQEPIAIRLASNLAHTPTPQAQMHTRDLKYSAYESGVSSEWVALLDKRGDSSVVDGIVRSIVPTWGTWNQDPYRLPELRKRLTAAILRH